MNEIKHFMTRSPHAIGHDQSLKLAHERMHHFGIQQLPVLEAGVFPRPECAGRNATVLEAVNLVEFRHF